MKLTSENVEDLFFKCLRNEGEFIDGVIAKAILDTTGHEDDIGDILLQLPNEFQESGGGGWSFLNACNTASGEQWTGSHLMMDKLFMLGIAAGKARWLLPREMWASLPGGVPYVSVN